jgi:hypothetical protein
MKPLFARLFGAKGALSASGAFAVDAADPFATDAVFNGFIAALDMADPLVALGELTAALDGQTLLGHLDRPELGGEARARLLLGLDDRASDCIAAIERGLFAHVAAETASEPRRLALLRYYERFSAEAIATLAGLRSSSKLAERTAAPGPQGPVSRPGGVPGGSVLKAPSAAAPRHPHANGAYSTSASRPARLEPAQALVLVNRALLAFYGRQKMLSFGHREIPSSLWSDVLKLRRYAAANNLLRTHCMPYPRQPMACNAAQLIALLMAYSAAPCDALRPNEMQALDRLLHHWFSTNSLDIKDNASGDATVYFYGAGMRGPFRALPAMHPPGDGVLYISLDEAYARAVDLAERVRETRVLPPELGPAACPIDAWIHLLESVVSHWSPNPPSRQSERRAHVGEMWVAPGFAVATRLIALSAQARAQVAARISAAAMRGPVIDVTAPDGTLSEPAFDLEITTRLDGAAGASRSTAASAPAVEAAAGEDPAEPYAQPPGATLRALQQLEMRERLPGIVKWQFLDHSATGFAVILSTPADWAHPGRVVTYRRENDSIWRMATIRRRTRDITGKIVLGLEKLPATPQPARIRTLSRGNWSEWETLRVGPLDFAPAIYFGSRPPLLLIERARYREGQRYLLMLGNERHLVELTVRKERDPDFVVARVEFSSAPVAERSDELDPTSTGDLMATTELIHGSAPPALN